MTTIRFYVGIGGRLLGRRKATGVLAQYYPQGFTAQRARGSWRDAQGILWEEPAVILTVCGCPDTDSGEECAQALKRVLRQQSVLVTTSHETATLL